MVAIQFPEFKLPEKSLNLRERYEQMLAPYMQEMATPDLERLLRNDIQMFFNEFWGDFQFELTLENSFLITPKRERDRLIVKDLLNIKI
jgi:hypothetical protein